MLTYLKDRYVSIDLWDRESSSIEEVGGGIEYEDPAAVVTLLDMNSDWVTYQWQHTGQMVMVPAKDVVCISTDLPGGTRVPETELSC